jgi:hypothetical protein
MHDAFEEAALVAVERVRAGRPNRTAKAPNGEFGTQRVPSFSKFRSLRLLAPTLPSLSPGYSAIIQDTEFSLENQHPGL